MTTFRPPDVLRDGPATQLDRINRADEAWSVMGPDQRTRLVRNLGSINWKDYFAGMGTRLQLQRSMCQTVNRHLHPDHALMTPKTHALTEIDMSRQAFLTSFDPQSHAKHRFGDMLQRLGEDGLATVNSMVPEKKATTLAKKAANRKICEFVDKIFDTSPVQWSHSYCFVHGKQCPVDAKFEGLDSTDNISKDCLETEDDDTIRAVSAGVPCKDISAMNLEASGDGGTTFTATSAFVSERGQLKEDLIICECTPRMDFGVVAESLQREGHQARAFPCRGRDVGDSYHRSRLDLLAISPRMTLVGPLEDFLQQCGSQPRFLVNCFWANSVEEDRLEIKEWASKRVHPVDEELRWDDVLLPSHKLRRNDYHRHWRMLQDAGKCAESSNLIADLDQNCKTVFELDDEDDISAGLDHRKRRRKSCGCFPTLITHGVAWNYELWRPMGALDWARAHSWPIDKVEVDHVGAAVNLKDMLMDGRLTHKSLQSLVGDSWAFRAQGMLLMWVISNLEFKSVVTGSPSRDQCLQTVDAPDDGDMADQFDSMIIDMLPIDIDTDDGSTNGRCRSPLVP